MKSLELPAENKTKISPGNRLPLSSDFFQATLETMELVEILMDSYQKVHQVILLDTSLVPPLQKIMG